MRRYPVGIQDFSEVRVGDYLYVDKTLFIEKLFMHGKYYFLSRPRRFGKSLFLSTLDYLFQAKKKFSRGFIFMVNGIGQKQTLSLRFRSVTLGIKIWDSVRP